MSRVIGPRNRAPKNRSRGPGGRSMRIARSSGRLWALYQSLEESCLEHRWLPGRVRVRAGGACRDADLGYGRVPRPVPGDGAVAHPSVEGQAGVARLKIGAETPRINTVERGPPGQH